MRQLLIGLLGLAMVPPICLAEGVALKSIKRIYVDKMPDDLDQYIRAEITKKFKGRVLVVLEPEAADAVMAGTGEHKSGTGAAVTGRWLGLHDTASGSVSLLDKSGKVVLWSSEAGDRSLWWGAMKRGGPRKVADRLVSNLKDALESNRVVEVGPQAAQTATPPPSTQPLPPPPAPVPSIAAPQAGVVVKPAVLNVMTDIVGAEISLDGDFVGSTPTTLNVVPGIHHLEVKRGTQIWKRDLQVHSGNTVNIQAELGAAPSPPQPQPVAVSQSIRIVCPENVSAVPFSSSRPDRRRLACDEQVTIVSETGNWIRVKTADGVEGNVAPRFVGK